MTQSLGDVAKLLDYPEIYRIDYAGILNFMVSYFYEQNGRSTGFRADVQCDLCLFSLYATKLVLH